MVPQKEISDEIYKALSHPIRRKILRLIKDNGTISFSDLINEVQLEVGTFYYHLDAIKPLINQNSERLYQLSSLGYDVFEIMQQIERQTAQKHQPRQRSFAIMRQLLYQIIVPSILFQYVAKRPRRFIFEAIIVVFVNAWIIAAAGLQPFLFYVTSTSIPNFPLTLTSFFIGWIIMFLFIEGLMRFLFHTKHGTTTLFTLTAFIRLPFILYAVLWYFRDFLFWISPLGWLLIQLVIELWIIWFAILVTSNAKLARPEQAAIVVLLLRFLVIIINGLFVFLVV